MAILCCLLLLVGSAVGQIDPEPEAGDCLCLTTIGVNVRSAPSDDGATCGGVIGSASIGQCYGFRDDTAPCSISDTAYTFYHLNFGTGDNGGWITGDYLRLGTDAECDGGGDWEWQPGVCSQVEIVSRQEWNARPPNGTPTPITLPVNMLFIHHTAGTHCTTKEACMAVVRAIQNYHMDNRGWQDIGYSYLVGEDGRAYVGRDWGIQGAHTGGYNSVGVAISVMGDFTTGRPNDAAMEAVNHLIDCAMTQGVLVVGTGEATDFKMWGHRDAVATACPGDSLYPEIRTWPYYCCSNSPDASNPTQPCSNRGCGQ